MNIKDVETTLEQQGVDFSKEIIEFSVGACNQVFMRGPCAGYSIRDLLTIWQHESGQKFKEIKDDDGE